MINDLQAQNAVLVDALKRCLSYLESRRDWDCKLFKYLHAIKEDASRDLIIEFPEFSWGEESKALANLDPLTQTYSDVVEKGTRWLKENETLGGPGEYAEFCKRIAPLYLEFKEAVERLEREQGA